MEHLLLGENAPFSIIFSKEGANAPFSIIFSKMFNTLLKFFDFFQCCLKIKKMMSLSKNSLVFGTYGIAEQGKFRQAYTDRQSG